MMAVVQGVKCKMLSLDTIFLGTYTHVNFTFSDGEKALHILHSLSAHATHHYTNVSNHVTT